MSLLRASTVPGDMLATTLVLAVGALAALLTALVATLAFARRQRAKERQRALVDPVTGLGSHVRLVRDLRLLSRGGDMADAHLLAMFELPRLSAYELEHGRAAADEVLGRLGRKLANAVGRAGGAYGLERGRFGVLARVGRVSEQVILQAATAVLSEEHPGVGKLARASTVVVPTGLTSPRDTLQWLEGLSELRPVRVSEAGYSRVGSATVVAPRHASAVAGGHGHGRGRSGPALLEREPLPRTTRRTSHHRRVPGFKDPVRDIEEPPLQGAPDAIAAARHRSVPRRNPPPRWMPYLRVSTRFRLSVLCGISWMCLSAWLAWPWINELASIISFPVALVLITGIALIPGYLNVQLVTSLLVDHPAPIDFDFTYPALTLLVAAYNEECEIAQTLAYVLDQEYPGPLIVIVIDDGSSDETVSIARGFARLDGRVRVMEVPHGGKAAALNAGLRATHTPLVATIDADTLLMPDALRRIVSRMLLSRAGTVAVAGSVMVRNSRMNLVTAAQTWDYFLGIGSIKRQQALLQATLVAQGAFSVYDTEALRTAHGWPDCIGEDIVMTWALLERGGLTTYEPSAVAFTEVPVTLRSLARQRRRWARGMIEGLRTYGRTLLRQRLPYVHSVVADMLFPYLDLTFTMAFIPGIVLAAFGNYAIVGPATLAVLPLNILIAGIMYRRQRGSFAQAGLRVRQSVIGFVAYLLFYQLVMSPVSLAGYVEEFFQTARRW
jgi:biofilm PGA synthesis N-glycosyltransferase PgaC